MSTLKTIFYGENLTPEQERIRSIIVYIFFGGVTTLVNMIVYIICDKLITLDLKLFNIDVIDFLNIFIAWVVAVTVAFLTNRAYVFKSKGPFFKELVSFFAARVVTLVVLEEGLQFLLTLILEKGFQIPKDNTMFAIFGFTFTYLYLVKVTVMVIEIFANYILSKLFVFRNKKKEVIADGKK